MEFSSYSEISHGLSSDPAKDIDLQTKLFVNFIDRLFILRDFSTIKYFYLLTYITDDYSINSWVSAVIRRKVEEMHLLLPHSYLYTPFLIPSSLFTCESLVTLRMGVRVVLNFLARLFLAKFKDEYFIERLLSNCPVLEDLNLDSCTWDNSTDLCISSATLAFHQQRNMTYTGFLAKKHVVHSFPLLVEAQISPAPANSGNSSPEQGSDAIKLLKELFNVKHLEFVIDCLRYAPALTDDHVLLKLPMFHNLRTMVVYWSYPSSIDRALLRLLQISPKLESLVFQNVNDCQSNKDDSWKLNIVPECPAIVSGLEHLKVFKFVEFCGDPWELF
ncbi:hypothetical protein MKW92_021651, partial [Papaver armeniacum]